MKFTYSPHLLPDAWTKPKTQARLHILRAHGASKAVIIRHKPSKRFHIISWNTATDALEFGSWFNGRIYVEKCDISWDGHWMIYAAMGSGGQTWEGICQPPMLRTVHDVKTIGTYGGGGVFSDAQTLQSGAFSYYAQELKALSKPTKLPFSIDHSFEDLKFDNLNFPNLLHRLDRDGWKREGEFSKKQTISPNQLPLTSLYLDDPGWSWQPTPKHPVLRMFYRGYLVHGYTFEFALEGSNLLDADVDWATWDAKGDLLVARQGSIERYTRAAIKRGTPDFAINLEHLAPPVKDTQDGVDSLEKQKGHIAG